jgi:hypothetical protein
MNVLVSNKPYLVSEINNVVNSSLKPVGNFVPLEEQIKTFIDSLSSNVVTQDKKMPHLNPLSFTNNIGTLATSNSDSLNNINMNNSIETLDTLSADNFIENTNLHIAANDVTITPFDSITFVGVLSA